MSGNRDNTAHKLLVIYYFLKLFLTANYLKYAKLYN